MLSFLQVYYFMFLWYNNIVDKEGVMFENEIILENLSKTMEIENQVLDIKDKEMLNNILEGKNTLEDTLNSIKKEYMVQAIREHVLKYWTSFFKN